MRKLLLLIIFIGTYCINCYSQATCAGAAPFCTASGTTFPASTGTTAPVGPNYGCLGSEPNPAWYYLQISTSGNINIDLSNSANVDIDFAAWGPFATQGAMCSGTSNSPFDCSYSTASTEQVNIVGAVVGQWYMVMITNFANVPTNISATTASGSTGATNCLILCNMTGLTATPGACVPATGLFSLSGTITTTTPPPSGTLTITSSCGGSMVLNPPFSTTINYTLPNLTANGAACSVTATYSADPTCTLTTSYTAPPPCNTCTATASNGGPYCAGATIGLTSTGGGTYSWAGPGAFSSTAQNPTRPGSTPAMAGTYTVTVNTGSTTCTSTTTVVVNPVPVITAPANVSVCAGSAIAAQTFTSTPAGATYAWTNSNTAIGLAASGTGAVSGFTGTNATASPITSTITVTPTLGGCTGIPITYTITINPQPTSTFTQSANQCFTGNSFTFTNTGINGASQNWTFTGGSPGTSTTSPAVVTYAAPGTYNVTQVVTGTGGCTSTTNSTVTIFAMPTGLNSTTGPATCGTSNGSITITGGIGGTAPYTYSVNGGAFSTTTSYTGQSAGSHTIIVKDANGCTFTTTVNVPTSSGPTSLAVTTVNSNCGASNGIINIGATTGGAGPYTYSVNGSGFTATTSYPGFAAGTYTVIVKDAAGCTFSTTATVGNSSGPTSIVKTITNSTCGTANGAITLGAVTGGTAPYTYSLNGGPFTASTSYTGLVANTYTLVVQDASGCQFTTTAIVSDLSGLTASITSQTNVSCNGGANGSVTVTASGSTAPYSYSLNGGSFVASGTFSGLTAGSFNITAKDANGCTFTVPVTITQPPALTGSIVSQTNPGCFGGANGSVTVTAGNGTSPYTYSIGGGAFGASASFSGLNAGSHPVVAKDANGCTVTISVNITQPTALTLTTSSVNAVCTAANGSATVVASGATPGYTYLWAPGNQSTATANNITAGNYSVLVTDLNGCSQTANVSVGSSPGGTAVISSTTNITCNSANNGSATVSMGAGATPTFTYAWTPSSQTTVTATGLAAGNYNVTVTDGNGCVANATATITEPAVISNSFTVTNVSCNGGSNGTAKVNPTGGTAPFTYFWTPGGQTSQTASGLSAGTYTCVITDANGCSKTVSTTITQPPAITITSTHIDANCNQSNGSANAAGAGGVGPYTYSWNTIPVQNTAAASALGANTYVVTVADANGCSQNLSVTVNNLAGPTASVLSTNNVSCNGQNDGSITATTSSGTAPFTYSWSPSGGSLPTASNLPAGTYTLLATDANGCTASTSATITEPMTLTTAFSVTNPSCANVCDASVTTSTVGGTPPYTYSWSPGGYTTQNVTGLCDGSYTLQVTDAHGCIVYKNVNIVDPVAITASTTTTNITCSGLCNGSATATPLTGTGPFTYLWSDGNSQTTQTATGLCAGSYTVTVTDANGCSAIAVATITTPAPLGISITSSGNVSCFGACDGFATASVTGGSAPFNYNWMPGGTAGSSVNNLCASTYTVTVTDANGCSANTNTTITQPNPLVASISNTNVSCYNACDAQATAVYTGGTGPYTFIWTPSLQTTPTAVSLCAGIQNLAITDSHGCTANASVTITQPTVLSVSTTTTNSNCGTADGTACAAIVGGSPPFVYSWNDPATQATSCASNLNAGVYTISVTDNHGCSVTNVANVNDNTAPVVTIPSSTDVSCNGAANGSAQGNITGGILPYTIGWTPGGQTSTFANNLSGGIYSLIVTDSVGCTGSASVTINEPFALVSGITAHTNTSCNLVCDGSATVQAGGGTAPYTYLWNDINTQTSATATGLCGQTYSVTTTDANGCTSLSTIAIGQPTPIVITLVSLTNVSCNGGNNGQITISVSGGTPGYTINWSPAGSGPTITNLTAGTYQATVTDLNGCPKTISFTILEPNPLLLTPNSNATTCGNANGSAGVSVIGGTAPYSYFWSPTALTTAIISNVTAGTYNVTVTDNNGCTDTVNSTVTNIGGPTATTSFTEPSCYGLSNGTATVVATGGQPLYTYSWSTTPMQTTQTASALPAGTYEVIVSDQNHCNYTVPVVITQPTLLQVIPAPKDTICIGQLSQIYAAGYGGTPPYTYTWNPSSFGTTGGPFAVTPTSTTTYTVSASDANGCVSSNYTTQVFVYPQITVTATDVSVCDGSPVTISAVAAGGNGGPYTYNWSNGPSTSSQIVTPTGASSIDYTVTANDAGCSIAVQDISTVVINPLPVSSMNVSDTAGCEDFTTTFSATSDPGATFSWNLGDGISSASGSPLVHTYVTPGSYDVTLTATNTLGCSASVSTMNYIDVYPAPTAGFTFTPDPATTTAPLITFIDQSIGATGWNWDFIYTSPPTGLFMDTLQNPTFSYPDSGIYVVQQIVKNSFGCTDIAYHNVEVIPEYVLYAPNAFTPLNHDGINDTFMPRGVGIDPQHFEMSIFDRWGNQIYKTTDISKGWDGRANGGSYVAQIDVYIWKIRTKDYSGKNHTYVGHVTIVK